MSVTSININGTTYPTIAAAREALDAMEEEANRQRVVGTMAVRTYWTIAEHERILSLARTVGGAQ